MLPKREERELLAVPTPIPLYSFEDADPADQGLSADMDLRVIPSDDSPVHVNKGWFLERGHNTPLMRGCIGGSPVAL
jgi:hypothetical protein